MHRVLKCARTCWNLSVFYAITHNKNRRSHVVNCTQKTPWYLGIISDLDEPWSLVMHEPKQLMFLLVFVVLSCLFSRAYLLAFLLCGS